MSVSSNTSTGAPVKTSTLFAALHRPTKALTAINLELRIFCADNELAQLNAACAEKNAEAAKMQAEVAKMTKKHGEAAKALKEAHAEVQAKHAEAEEARAEVERIGDKLEKSEKKLEGACAEAARLGQMCEEKERMCEAKHDVIVALSKRFNAELESVQEAVGRLGMACCEKDEEIEALKKQHEGDAEALEKKDQEREDLLYNMYRKWDLQAEALARAQEEVERLVKQRTAGYRAMRE
ncbi:uncharacterized protein BDZ99DRAFT_493706 [Mytilinidion resinicola]|uniref:Uncharacterized protein n=1 Tax=Mytilinidion resinicola TaxID=574789 RepID=A0A6A6Z673_9PEZI|nr:uncharacterized protein BDZ99DRAFT_493706 [Mytilinidion resinicola]KAF2815725.1 hypothetical protein BDZ99DRAFT_493706 [Mytilinidion resinicola]